MLLDMALGSKAPTSFRHRCQVTAALLLIVCVTLTNSAPTTYDEIEAKQTDLTDYFNDPNGCYYNYQHYEEGDRIVTNEPCLNCTCHNRMLMCYLRVCPFSKAIGQDCTVQKSPDQCCPVISCPEVPVHLLTSSTTQRSTTTTSTTTEIGWRDDYGCMMNENGFFPDGAQVPSDPKKPCELCYCIRNRTACVMQECTLHVEGCRPVYQDGVCCPVRYDCDYESEKSTTSAPQITGGLVFSTTSAPFDCKVNDEVYRDGESISMVAEKPCEHCYCMRGDIVCAVQDCGEPLRGKDCTPETPPAGQCCPTSYQCPNETMNSYDYLTTLPSTVLSDSDENEAEKYPSNEDAYDKLGEHQPSQQDDTNDVDFKQPLTTAAYDNELPPAGTSEQSTNKNEATHDSVSENHDTAGGPNILSESDSTHINSEENKPDHSSAKPESANQVVIGTESDPSKYESTGKPIEPTSINEAQPTQSPAADSLLNENIVSPTAQTTDDKNNINEGSNNESSTQIQDAIAPSLPVQPTESSMESETQSSNPQNKLQEGIQQQTETPAEKEPIQSGNDEQNVDIKSSTETTSHINQDPSIHNNGENTEKYTEENKIVTIVPLSEDTEQTTQTLIQADNVNTPLENSNAQTDTTSSNIDQNNSDQSNQDITQSPQEGNLPTDNQSNIENNSLNNDNAQEGIVSSTEIPKVVNEQDENKPQSEITPTEKYQDNLQQENVVSTEIPKIENESNEQNKPLVENDPQTENGPESEVTPTEKYQDGSQSENVMPTEIPKVEIESTEQNKPTNDNIQQTENQPESVQTTIETNNLESSQAENISPTEIPKLENEPTEQNKPLVESSTQTESQPGSNKTPTEQTEDSTQDENASPTQISTMENEPTEQNKPFIESSPQTESQPESDKTPTGQNQDGTQDENASSTEIPNIVNEPTEQNKPLVESSPQTEAQSGSDQTSTEQNLDDTQDENASSTEIPNIVNEPTEQNKPLVESSPQTEGQSGSDQTSTEQNQDDTQDENASSTEIPNIVNEPTEQNKPLVESSPQTEGQSGLDQTPTEQNQDDTQDENASPTEIPNIASEPTEQNKPLEENSPQTESQSESDKSPTGQNQESTQDGNALPTEIPNIVSEPTEQNKPLVESSPQTEGQSESEQSPTGQNQDDIQDENVLPTEIPNIASDPTEQNKPLAESSPQTESQPESDKTPTEQNQDSAQDGNALPTEIPNIVSEPTEQNKPLVEINPQTEGQSESEQSPTEQNQDGTQDENASPTKIPNIVGEPTEQNKPLVESSLQTEGQTGSDQTLTEQNQDNIQDENASPTEIPNISSEPTELNKPLEENSPQTESQSELDKSPTGQKQDSTEKENVSSTELPKIKNQDAQSENMSPTEIPKVENVPTENNIPLPENITGTEDQPESDKLPTKQNNQDISQSENVTPTEIPNVQREPIEQNKPLEENISQTKNPLESDDKTPTEQQNQENVQGENLSPTETSKIVSETTEQNKPLVDGITQTESQPESDKIPAEQNQDSIQENASSTQIPNIESEPTEQNKPLVESSPYAENQPEPPKTLAEENQNNPQVENVSSTEIPSKLNEPQSENAVTENALAQPAASAIPVNDVSTEHPIEDNNIFVIVPTSPSLLSQNQVKGDELSSNSTGSDIGNKATTLAENDESKIVENAPSSADDKTSSTEKTNMENASAITSTETAPENSNVSPQFNDENTEHSTETKPISVEVSNDVTIAPAVDPHASTPIIATELDNKFGSNNPVSLEPSATPTTESNDDVNSGIINQDVLVDDVSSQENDSENENDEDTPILDSSEHQIAPQTDNPTETESSTNADTPAVNEPVNDVTTSLPQQQQVPDNSIPVIPVEVINPSEPIKKDEKTEAPSVPSENTVPEKSQDSHVPTEVGGVQHSDEITKSTESSILDASGIGQSIPTQDSVQINENESVTPHVQSQDENVNEIEDHTSVYPDTSSNDENNSNTANGLVQNNEESSTSLSDKIETGTNGPNTEEEPVKINDGVVPVENESSTISQVEQVNQGNSENADTIETTNSYTEIPSVASITNAPTSITAENDANPSVNPSNDVETNVKNDRPANVKPQQSINSDETSTQYNAYDISTNGPIQETPNENINNNVETSTNIPSYSEIPNEVNQDSITETEQYATQSPTEKNVLTDDSDKTPTKDATMEAISNLTNQSNNLQTNTNEIINGYPSEGSDKPTVLKTPDYVIDITTVSSNELPNINSGLIETGDQANTVNEVTTSNIDKNNDVTTELYDSEQAGVPGEGSCLIDFVTYAHKAEVPKSNPCHEKCECLNSIVTCTSVNCPPAPPQHRNCIPLHPGNESWCCPTYMCEGGIEGVLFESNNQLGSPQLISTVVLEDKPGEENDDKTNVDEEVSSTSSPQIAEYNTVPPSQTDTTNDNSQYPVGATEVSTPSESPIKPIENSVATGSDNDIPVTTAVNLETVENDKPIESNKPINAGDKPVESEQPSKNEKPVESDEPLENEKPVESDEPLENEKPVESDQSTENETSEDGVTIVSYTANEQIVTNKPEGVNNIEGQNGLLSVVNESQDNLLPSTEVPNYESAVTNVIPTNDQNVPEENSGLDDSVTATTYKPNDSILDDNKTEEGSQPMVDEKHDTVPVAVGITDLPESDVKQPIEVTQTPTIIADANPTAVENNVNGLRPTSIDDIISSVNMVKDAVKNSLETSSRPAEIDYPTTTGSAETAENYQPTVVPENAVNPSSEIVLVDKYDEPLTTVSSVNVVPELQTDNVNEKLPESPAVTVPSDEVGSAQVLNISPSANADQGVSTEIPLYVPDKYEIESSSAVADVNENQPEVPVDDKNSEVTTTQNLPSLAAEQDQTSNGPTTGNSDAGVPQVDVESNTNLPETVVNNDKTPAEVITPVIPSFAHQGVHTDDAANKPVEQDKPNAENPAAQDPEANADETPVEVPIQSTVSHSSTTEYAVTDTPDMNDKRFGVPSSSPASTAIHEDNKRPQESSGDMVNIPFDTEKPLTKPSSSTPASALYTSSKPSYTPIPQSTWTQKPFHQDSTSESPQPDQGFPDEYDDENEAVYGPGTCRYGGKIYVSAQQVPREDPCDFCFCFRGDIICLQQSCPPPIFGCYQENIQGFCCPRYECPVAQATSVNVTTTTTTTTTMVPPHFFANAYRGAARRTGCLIHGHAYRVGEDVGIASGPCLECICGADGKMKCDPKPCSPEPLLRKIMAEAVDQRKR